MQQTYYTSVCTNTTKILNVAITFVHLLATKILLITFMRGQHYQCSDPIIVFSQSQKSLTNTDFNGFAKSNFQMDLLFRLSCVADC